MRVPAVAVVVASIALMASACSSTSSEPLSFEECVDTYSRYVQAFVWDLDDQRAAQEQAAAHSGRCADYGNDPADLALERADSLDPESHETFEEEGSFRISTNGAAERIAARMSNGEMEWVDCTAWAIAKIDVDQKQSGKCEEMSGEPALSILSYEMEPIPVLVVNAPIDAGTPVEELNSTTLRYENIPRNELPAGAVDNLDTVEGKVVAEDLMTNEVLTSPALQDP